MKRSIVKQGPSTLMVSIPTKWVKKYDIKKGDQVDVEESSRGLLISTGASQRLKLKDIRLLSSNKDYIWREISAAYVSGYEEIRIDYKTDESYIFIEEYVLPTFTGFEIVEHGKNHCVLKQILKEDVSEFNTILRRIFLNLIHTSDVFLDILETGKGHNRIIPLQKTNNRQTYYLKRLLTREKYINEDKTNFAYSTVFLLELLANQYKYCTWIMDKDTIKHNDDKIISLYKEIHKKIELVYKLYFSYSPELFEKIKNDTIFVDSRTGEVIDDIGSDPKIIHYFISIIEKLNYIAYQIHSINS